jgi:hypothetical protein
LWQVRAWDAPKIVGCKVEDSVHLLNGDARPWLAVHHGNADFQGGYAGVRYQRRALPLLDKIVNVLCSEMQVMKILTKFCF